MNDDDRSEYSGVYAFVLQSIWGVTACLALAAVLVLNLQDAPVALQQFGSSQGEILMTLLVIFAALAVVATSVRRNSKHGSLVAVLHGFFSVFTLSAATLAIAFGIYRNAVMFPNEWSAVVGSASISELIRNLGQYPFPFPLIQGAVAIAGMAAIILAVYWDTHGSTKRPD